MLTFKNSHIPTLALRCTIIIYKIVYKLLFQYLKAIIEMTQKVRNALGLLHIRVEFGCATDEGFVVEYGKCTCDLS